MAQATWLNSCKGALPSLWGPSLPAGGLPQPLGWRALRPGTMMTQVRRAGQVCSPRQLWRSPGAGAGRQKEIGSPEPSTGSPTSPKGGSPAAPLPWPLPPPPPRSRDAAPRDASLLTGTADNSALVADTSVADVSVAYSKDAAVAPAAAGAEPSLQCAAGPGQPEGHVQCALAALDELMSNLELQAASFGEEAAQVRRHFRAARQAAHREGPRRHADHELHDRPDVRALRQ
uniref:Uncharacterized protein n=1 Tax=Alexandrium monilatum TaxID=311494 RepID=A0A7S4TAV7_9DINO